MQAGDTILLTLRLAGSLPAATVRELAALRQAPDNGRGHHAQKVFFAKFDAALDQGATGPRYFENEKIAEALAGEILIGSITSH